MQSQVISQSTNVQHIYGDGNTTVNIYDVDFQKTFQTTMTFFNTAGKSQ